MGRPQRSRFALCADDYAMTPGISRGILEGLDAGALTATSVMTTSPWWPEHSTALMRFADRADIGLHLNLTQGAPLGLMPTLAPSGVLPGIGAYMRLRRANKAVLDEIADEIDRQCDRFVAVVGRAPDHFDGHQHVHGLGPIAALVTAAVRKRGWRSWLRNSADRPDRIMRRGECLAKAFGIAVLSRGLGPEARRAGIPTNDGFSGFSAFDAAADYGDRFARYLRAPGRNQLVMCHPGIVDDHLRGLDPVVETREQELRFLLSPHFGELIASFGASPTRMSAMLS